MNNFDFIDDSLLRKNLNITFNHIVDLLSISSTNTYKYNPELINSLRKTILIHTAAIIEALLLWKLKAKIKSDEIEMSDEWKYKDIKILHKFEEGIQLVCAKRQKEKKSIDKLDFYRIIDYCTIHKIIDNSLRRDLDKVRRLRNRLHIGNLTVVDNEYSKKDLEFIFMVARRIKEDN